MEEENNNNHLKGKSVPDELGNKSNVPSPESPVEDYSGLSGGIREVVKDKKLLIFIIIWVIFIIFRFAMSMSIKPAATRDNLSRSLRVMENILFIDFFRAQTGSEGSKVLDELFAEVRVLYKKSAEEDIKKKEKEKSTTKAIKKETKLPGSEIKEIYKEKKYPGQAKDKPKDIEPICKYIILEATSGDIKKAVKFFEKNHPKIDNAETKAIIESLYLTDGILMISEYKASKLERMIKRNMKGWFRDKSLLVLYKKSGREIDEKKLIQDIRKKNYLSLAGIFLIGTIVITGLFLGPIILIAVILLSILASFFPKFEFFNRRSLASAGVRNWNNDLFSLLSLRKVLWILIIWDFTRILFSLIIAFYFDRYYRLPPTIMFIAYSTMYIFIFWVAIQAIAPKGEKMKLEAIGLPSFNFSRAFIDVLIGAATYFAAIPAIFVAVVIYQYIFRSGPESVNPAFEIISEIGGPIGLLLVFLIIGILGPIFEEILFRGILYTTLRRYMSACMAIILVSFMFSLIHFDPGVIFPLFLLGAVLAIVYEKTGSLVPGIITHIMWNSMTFIAVITLMK